MLLGSTRSRRASSPGRRKSGTASGDSAMRTGRSHSRPTAAPSLPAKWTGRSGAGPSGENNQGGEQKDQHGEIVSSGKQDSGDGWAADSHQHAKEDDQGGGTDDDHPPRVESASREQRRQQPEGRNGDEDEETSLQGHKHARHQRHQWRGRGIGRVRLLNG